MYRTSNLLTNARVDKDLSIAEIAKKLKVPVKYLEAFETENTKDFPSEPYCSLILKDYSEYLGLNGQEMICFFRRDFDQRKKTKTIRRSFFTFTPQFTFGFAVFILVLFFSGYILSEYIKFNRPPKLKINWPADATVLGASLDISGSTDPESTVKVNDDLVIVDFDGTFQKKINVASGEAKVIVESKSPNGKTTREEKIIKVAR